MAFNNPHGNFSLYIIGSSIFIAFVPLVFLFAVEISKETIWIKVYTGYALFVYVHQCYIDLILKNEKGFVQIDLFFLTMYFFVMFWVWFEKAVGLSPVVSNLISINPLHLNYSLVLSSMGMSAFVLGFNLISNRRVNDKPKYKSYKVWLKVGNLIYYVGLVLALSYFLYFGKSAFEGSYEGSAVGNLAVRSIYLLHGIFLKLGIAIILIASAQTNEIIRNNKIAVTSYIAVLIVYLILGDRSEFVFSTAVGLFAYTFSIRKISFTILFISILSVAFLSSVVRIARTYDDRSLSNMFSVMTTERDDVSVSAGLANISGSGLLTLTAVSAVPDKYDYFAGSLKYRELLGIVPFGRAILEDTGHEKHFHGTSQWLTWYILGPHSNWGVGTNIVADLYLDFGAPGVFMGLFILGNIAGYFKQKASANTSITMAVIYCYYAGVLTIIPRYGFLFIVRGLLWIAVIMWILNQWVMFNSNSQSAGIVNNNESR